VSNGVTGYAVIMNKLEELLNKVPQSVKDKFLIKKRERAIEIVKQKLTDSKKNISDFSDDEMEGLIGDEEKKLKDDQLIAILVGVAAAEGISLIIG
jgi:Ni,Fe-hydrogenase III component G